MAPIRVRHPQGVSTIQIDLNNASVQDLQHQIFSISEITPSQQELRAGYPPRTLTIIPELPLSSLGLNQGDQLIVTQKLGSGTPVAPSATLTSPAKSKVVPGPVPIEAAPVPRSAAGGSVASGSTGGPDYVQTDAGFLIHRIVPDDNSCLFSSVALVFEQDISKASKIRQVVADVIRADEETWNEAILGRPRQEYISVILKPTSWGGAIELSILATHYGTEIASIDVETGRIDHFTPLSSSQFSSPSPSNRCILIYTGIHYDAASLAPFPDAPADFHQTVYPISVIGGDDDADPILRAAKSLADKLRAKKAYTNTATFDLKCEICKKGLKGEKEARAHAAETGHTSFGEF